MLASVADAERSMIVITGSVVVKEGQLADALAVSLEHVRALGVLAAEPPRLSLYDATKCAR